MNYVRMIKRDARQTRNALRNVAAVCSDTEWGGRVTCKYLVVVQVQVAHGERGEAHGARGLAALLHVARYGEQLRRSQRAAGRRPSHRRARRLKRTRRALTHR